MGKIYARQIMNNEAYTVADVPEFWMSKTMAAFDEFVTNDTITAAQFELHTGQTHESYKASMAPAQ